jgi:hypothetical protein
MNSRVLASLSVVPYMPGSSNLRVKRQLGRPRHIWEDNIKTDLQEVGYGVWNGTSWIRIGTGGGHL